MGQIMMEPIIKIEIDQQTLYNADCFDVMPGISDGSVDMILVDLPYNMTGCKFDKEIIPLDKLWLEYERIIKPNGVMVFTASQPFTSKLVMSNLKLFKCEWIWEKNNSSNYVNAKLKPMKIHENILVFSKGTYNGEKSTYNPQKTIGKPYKKKHKNYNRIDAFVQDTKKIELVKDNNGTRFPTSIQKFGTAYYTDGRHHPTQKPLSLFEYLIKTYSNEGETILDNCAGSMTTAVAAKNTNRKSICIEKDETYFNNGISRMTETISTETKNETKKKIKPNTKKEVVAES